jgi:hypothetical protein
MKQEMGSGISGLLISQPRSALNQIGCHPGEWIRRR